MGAAQPQVSVTTLCPLVLQPVFLTLRAWGWRRDGTGVTEKEYDEGKFSSTDYFVSLLSQCFLAWHVFGADMQGPWGLRTMPLPHTPPLDGQPLTSVLWPSCGVSLSSAWFPLDCRNFASLSCCWWKYSLSVPHTTASLHSDNSPELNGLPHSFFGMGQVPALSVLQTPRVPQSLSRLGWVNEGISQPPTNFFEEIPSLGLFDLNPFMHLSWMWRHRPKSSLWLSAFYVQHLSLECLLSPCSQLKGKQKEFYFSIFYVYLEVVGRRQKTRFSVQDTAELEWDTKEIKIISTFELRI